MFFLPLLLLLLLLLSVSLYLEKGGAPQKEENPFGSLFRRPFSRSESCDGVCLLAVRTCADPWGWGGGVGGGSGGAPLQRHMFPG